MSSQPVSAAQYTIVTGVGTTVITDRSANLYKVILPGTFVGSVEWYDTSTTAGTAATNKVYNVGIPLLNQYREINLDLRVKNGLVAVATGTPTLTFTWD